MNLSSGLKIQHTSSNPATETIVLKHLRIFNCGKSINQLLASRGNRYNPEFYKNLIYNLDLEHSSRIYNYVRSTYETTVETLTSITSLNNYYIKIAESTMNTIDNLPWQICDNNQGKVNSQLFGYPCKSKISI